MNWAIFPNRPFSFFISILEVFFRLIAQIIPNRRGIIIKILCIFLFRFAGLDHNWDILETGCNSSLMVSHGCLVLRGSACCWLSWLMIWCKIGLLLELAGEIIIAGGGGLLFRGFIGKKWLFDLRDCSVFPIGAGGMWAVVVKMLWGNDGSSHYYFFLKLLSSAKASITDSKLIVFAFND